MLFQNKSVSSYYFYFRKKSNCGVGKVHESKETGSVLSFTPVLVNLHELVAGVEALNVDLSELVHHVLLESLCPLIDYISVRPSLCFCVALLACMPILRSPPTHQSYMCNNIVSTQNMLWSNIDWCSFWELETDMTGCVSLTPQRRYDQVLCDSLRA